MLMDTASFCNNCGARVTDEVFDSEKMKNCDHCGAVLYKSARFCTNCGLPVDVPEAKGYAGKCERCGTWLKPNAQFCTNCGRRVTVKSYNFTQQAAAPVQAAVVPAYTQPPANESAYAPLAEEPQQPKVLPPLSSRPTRKNDYEDDMRIDMSFDLPPVDEIVVPAPAEEAPAPAEEIIDIEPVQETPSEPAVIPTEEPIQPEPFPEAPAEPETEALSGEVL